ncbi:MAG TPA: hypothetical protein VJH05_00040 [Candidatus Paceibacterota bacterium]
MWKQWTIAILGLIFIITPFLGFTTFIFKALTAFGGVVFAILGFWLLSAEKLSDGDVSVADGENETKSENSHDFQ